jgi:hypothetical protein
VRARQKNISPVFSGKSRGRPRTLGMIALVLSAFVNLAFFIGFAGRG